MIEAARRWAGGQGAGADEAAKDLAAFGVPEDEVAECLEEPEFVFEVMPANWPAVETFCCLSTQWRYVAGGIPVGLDYLAVEPTARMLGYPATREMLEALRIMESEALEVFARKHNR